MDGLTFAASLTQNLAWPVTVILLVLILRKPITTALSTLQHLKAGGVEASFGSTLAGLERHSEQAQEIDGPPSTETTSTPEPAPPSTEASSDPSGVVLRAWGEVETAIDGLLKAAHITYVGSKTWPINRKFQHLVRDKLISESTFKAINDLIILRNQVAHGSHIPTPGEAFTYAETAHVMAKTVKYVADQYTARDGKPPREQRP